MKKSEFQDFVIQNISLASENKSGRIFFSENNFTGSSYPYVMMNLITFKNTLSKVYVPARKILKHTKATVSVRCKGPEALDNANIIIQGLEDMEGSDKTSFSLISGPDNRTAQENPEKNIERYDFDLEVNRYEYVIKPSPKIEKMEWEASWL